MNKRTSSLFFLNGTGELEETGLEMNKLCMLLSNFSKFGFWAHGTF